MLHPKSRWLFFLLGLVLLAGCAGQPPQIPPPQETGAQAALWHWQLQGRLAIQQGTQRHNASLEWQQDYQNYQLLIFGPMGQGSARLNGQPFQVDLVTADGQHLQASSPEQLIQQGLGWDLPLSNLVYWVRGLPAPGSVDYRNEQTLHQQGWVVEWPRWTQTQDYPLPTLIVASRGDFTLRLAITEWTLLNP